jgi:hypothetical protein
MELYLSALVVVLNSGLFRIVIDRANMYQA